MCPPTGQRVSRVQHQIQNDLLELVGVDPDERRSRGKIARQRDVLPDRASQHVFQFGDRAIEVDLLGDRRAFVAEREELFGERRRLLAGFLDFLEVRASDVIGVGPREEQLRVS